MRFCILVACALLSGPCALPASKAVAKSTSSEGFAPETLSGAYIDSEYDKWSGDCSQFATDKTTTFFGGGGRYSDLNPADETGQEFIELGTYVYERLQPSQARMTYQVVQVGPWEAGEWVEILQFDSPTSGTFEGSLINGNCTYSGRFKIKQW
jgi:hypothetical protein